jgi:protein ImuA
MNPFAVLDCEAEEPGAESREPNHPDSDRTRTEIVEDLRRALPRLEGFAGHEPVFRFGLPEIDTHLPAGGLAAGALHEVFPQSAGDLPSAFAFLAVLLGRMPGHEPLLLVLSPRGLNDYGMPHGHGLNTLGLSPFRLILVETENETQALWALEEALRSGVPAAVAGVLGKSLDLKTSRRLHLAAGSSGIPLFLMQPATVAGSSAAATRWRIGQAKATPDRFGLFAQACWRLRLDRCRNGRPGDWLVEFDHVAYRFCLAAALADPALSRFAGEKAG